MKVFLNNLLGFFQKIFLKIQKKEINQETTLFLKQPLLLDNHFA